jgi:hypothetical protein
MKKALLAIVAVLCATAFTLSAADEPKKKTWTPEQKELMKKMVEKYDANKDGKLDKEERAKISAEDQAKMKEAGISGGQRKKKAE